MKKLFVMACLASTLSMVTGCDEGVYRDGTCDENYVSECLNENNYMICKDGKLTRVECGEGSLCKSTTTTNADGTSNVVVACYSKDTPVAPTCDCATGANCTDAEKAACEAPKCDCATGANCTDEEKAACEAPKCDCETGDNCTDEEKAACEAPKTCDCETGDNCTDEEKAACEAPKTCDCETGDNCTDDEKAACEAPKTCDCETGDNCTATEELACLIQDVPAEQNNTADADCDEEVFVENCAGDVLVYCLDGKVVNEDCAGYNDEEDGSEYTCAVTAVSSSLSEEGPFRNYTECVGKTDEDLCTEKDLEDAEGELVCYDEDDYYEFYMCMPFNDGKLHWILADDDYCDVTCAEGCFEEE